MPLPSPDHSAQNLIFIPGMGWFGFVSPPDENDRRFKGPVPQSPNVQETTRAAHIPVPNDSENLNDRRFEGPLQSTDLQEKNRDATGINAPNDVVDRKAMIDLPQQSDTVKKVYPSPPPSYHEAPRISNDEYKFGSLLYVDSKAESTMPSLCIEYKFERPNKIHLHIQVRNLGYWVSELEFKIKFCDGHETIKIESYRPSNESFNRKDETTNHKETMTVGAAAGVPQLGGNLNLRQEYVKEFKKVKESYIEIEGRPEKDGWISWLWYTVGGSAAGPLKTTTLNVSIRIPKDKRDISQLTASVQAKPKCYKKGIIGYMGHILIGETAKSLTDEFCVELDSPAED